MILIKKRVLFALKIIFFDIIRNLSPEIVKKSFLSYAIFKAKKFLISEKIGRKLINDLKSPKMHEK